MKTHLYIPLLALLVLAFVPATASDDEAQVEIKRPTFKADDPAWKMDFSVAETLAVQEDRRKKPLQTYAFETIEQMYGRPLMGSTFVKVPTGEPGDKDNPKVVKMGAVDLYLSIWFFPGYWYDKPLILVSNSELRKQLTPPISLVGADAALSAGFERDSFVDEKHLSIKDLQRSSLFSILQSVQGKPDDKLTGGEKEAKLVYRRIELFEKIASSFGRYDEQGNLSMLALVPHPDDSQGAWISLTELFDQVREFDPSNGKSVYPHDEARKACEAYIAFREAYKPRDNSKFVDASKALKGSLQKLSTIYPSENVLDIEVQYNNARPFAWAWIFYLLTALTALVAIKARQKAVYAAAMVLYFAGLGLHVYGFALRCYIAGRPPVSNMYESVIWVGFGAVFFGMIFELIFRKRYYMLAGSFAGFLCLVLMDLVPVIAEDSQLAGFKSNIEPLQPVLRDNFWLTVHVLTITLSYAAFMLAWGMGHITLWAHLTRPTQRNEHRELHQFVYRVIQVGVLLLAIGTILGGVWAYYSWGRFWGWDPKETWAFIALMCYIVVLHGRFAGLWTNFGLAFGSVFCFQAIVMAWYGVNFVLGSSKHGYGSGGGGKEIVLSCVGVDMLFLAAATYQYVMHRGTRTPPAGDNGTLVSGGDNLQDEDQSHRGRVDDPPAANAGSPIFGKRADDEDKSKRDAA